MTSDITKAIEASSLGTRGAKAHRRRVPRETATRIVAASSGKIPADSARTLGGKR